MISMTGTTMFDDIKAKQRQTWSSGDYTRVAWLTVPVAEHLVETVGLRPGSRVLDVATGTGHVAIAAARRFCQVTGIDYVPGLLATADRRVQAGGTARHRKLAPARVHRPAAGDGGPPCRAAARGTPADPVGHPGRHPR